MEQILRQLFAMRDGKNVAAQINDILSENPFLQFTSISPIPISKIGGVEYEYIVLFETRK